MKILLLAAVLMVLSEASAKEVPVTADTIKSFGDVVAVGRVESIRKIRSEFVINIHLRSVVWDRARKLRSGNMLSYRTIRQGVSVGKEYVVVLAGCGDSSYRILGGGFLAPVVGEKVVSEWYGFPAEQDLDELAASISPPKKRDAALTNVICMATGSDGSYALP